MYSEVQVFGVLVTWKFKEHQYMHKVRLNFMTVSLEQKETDKEQCEKFNSTTILRTSYSTDNNNFLIKHGLCT